MRAVFLDAGSLDTGDLDLDPLRDAVDALSCYGRTATGEVVTHLGDAAIAITNKVVIDQEVLAACPNLQLVCVVATGTNNVDLAAAEARGVRVVNCRDYATATVPQHVLALLLSLVRSLPSYTADVTAGDWQRSPFFCRLDHSIHELAELELGVIGYGNLGRATAELASAVGMSVNIAERADQPQIRGGRLPFDDVLRRSDIVSLHCPLTAATQQLIGRREIGLIGEGGYLINTARGGLLDERAVADALAEGRLAGAGLDVLSEEPPVSANPLLERRLPNLLITPHCAWGSQAARRRVVDQTAANIRAFRAGQPERIVV